jgi:hypothetical protein
MKSLREIIDEAGETYDVKTIVPGFRALADGRIVTVQSILDLTAIVYPIHLKYPTPDDRSVVSLTKVLLEMPEKLTWVERGTTDARIRVSRRRGGKIYTALMAG